MGRRFLPFGGTGDHLGHARRHDFTPSLYGLTVGPGEVCCGLLAAGLESEPGCDMFSRAEVRRVARGREDDATTSITHPAGFSHAHAGRGAVASVDA